MNIHRSGVMGIVLTVIGAIFLAFTFFTALDIYQSYADLQIAGGEFMTALNQILVAAIQAMFLGIMGWVGSIILVRAVDFMKVDRGVGVVTFRVEKGVGVATLSEGSEEKPSESKEGTR